MRKIAWNTFIWILVGWIVTISFVILVLGPLLSHFLSSFPFGRLFGGTFYAFFVGLVLVLFITSARLIRSPRKKKKRTGYLLGILPAVLSILLIVLIVDYHAFGLTVTKRFTLDNSAFIPLRAHTSFLLNYVYKNAREELRTDPGLQNRDNQLTTAAYRTTLQTFSNQVVKDFMLHTILEGHIYRYGKEGLDDLITDFSVSCANEEYKLKINTLYEVDKFLTEGQTIKIYKTVNDISLNAYIFYPPDREREKRYPAIVFFHGGGWHMGRPEWCFDQCKHWSLRGMVAISAQYRLKDRHGVTPLECMADAKSAIRWIRLHADELGVDPDRIIASGFSAGGHIAACAGIIKGFDEPFEDLTVSSVPDALVLYYPCVNTVVDTWFVSLLNGRADSEDCSPAHHIRSGLPPTIIFHGTADQTVPFRTVKEFADKMKKAGNRCELHAYKDRGHIVTKDTNDYEEILLLAEKFLASLGYIVGGVPKSATL